MTQESDRRAQEATRVPFDAMVEVGGALGPAFEAQAINVSGHGMHLRTAYLPEVGQPLSCRFDVGNGMSVLASGVVIWKQEEGKGGEFGIRFTNLDDESVEALHSILGGGEKAAATLHAMQQPGSKIRLHIEGLNSPMRARVKDSSDGEVTAFSELGFLQVGKHLELEDAGTGEKRPARLDRVNVEIDPDTRVPQLVVTLKYEDEDAPAEAMASSDEDQAEMDMPMNGEDVPEEASAMSAMEEEEEGDASVDEESEKMKSPFARQAAKVIPALNQWAMRTKSTISLLAQKKLKKEEEGTVKRRTTAPAPSGGLHASGRKVVRGEPEDDRLEESEPIGPMGTIKANKRKIAAAGAVVCAITLGAFMMRKPEPVAPLATIQPDVPAAAPAPAAPPTGTPAQPMDPNAQFGAIAPAAGNGTPMAGNFAENGMVDDGMNSGGDVRRAKVQPFGNGPVSRGNILRLKMDGPIDSIQGAQQPEGFTVVLPGRKSLEAASPLASKDSRIAQIHVANDQNGAELAVAFKDGVPNYQVRAKGDTLEIVLASRSASANADGPIAEDRPARVKKVVHHSKGEKGETTAKKKHKSHKR